MFPPTTMASLLPRSSNTRYLDSLLLIHDACPLLAAIFPVRTKEDHQRINYCLFQILKSSLINWRLRLPLKKKKEIGRNKKKLKIKREREREEGKNFIKFITLTIKGHSILENRKGNSRSSSIYQRSIDDEARF